MYTSFERHSLSRPIRPLPQIHPGSFKYSGSETFSFTTFPAYSSRSPMLHFLSFFMLFLVLPLVTPLATPVRDLTLRQSGELQKRFDNTQWSYYNVGM